MQGSKFARVGNNTRSDVNNINYEDEDEHVKRSRDCANDINRLCGWPSSRIVRVSRASGGKDRHSKVWTSKGLRDRRVRLSVTTAIQFYDLQDRLGYDQPSKAVEWLLNAAATSISELPSLNPSFPDTPKQLSDEKRSSGGSADLEFQNVSLSKSGCSSTSETSKGSGLSLSRSESRLKARERARGRAAVKEKEKESESGLPHHQNVNHLPQNSSFIELLTGGMNVGNNNTTSESNLFHKSPLHWPSTPMDYFTNGLRNNHQSPSLFSGINSIPMSSSSTPFSVTGDHHHQELQQFSFVPDNLVPGSSGGSDYNLNFTISSGLSGYNRGTLQSNTPSLFPHIQRFNPIDGSNIPFFIGTAAPTAATPLENHHTFSPGFDGRLQLYYGDGGRHSDHKGKGKN